MSNDDKEIDTSGGTESVDKPEKNFFVDKDEDGRAPKKRRGEWTRILKFWNMIFTILASMVVIVTTLLVIMRPRDPKLKAQVDCENWQAPSYVEEEIKGIEKARKLCSELKKVIEPDLHVAFPDVNNLSCKIIEEIQGLGQYEANNIENLKSMHTILVKNEGDRISENVVLSFRDAKYIEYQKEGEEKKRYRDRGMVNMGNLSPKKTVLIRVWAISTVSRSLRFNISQQVGSDVSYYIRTPICEPIEWMSKHKVKWVIVFTFLCLLCIFLCYYGLVCRFLKKLGWCRP